jgi:hypothetical protein
MAPSAVYISWRASYKIYIKNINNMNLEDEALVGMVVTTDGSMAFCRYKYVVEKMRKITCCSEVSPSQIVHGLMSRAADIEENIAQKNKEDAECLR